MSYEAELAALTAAVAELTTQVNVRRASLDAAIAEANDSAAAAALSAAKYGPSVTFSELLALTGMQAGDIRFVSNCGERGSLWVYSGALWIPFSGEYLHFQRAGLIAAPLATIAAGSTAEQFFGITIPDIPAYVLKQHSQISVVWSLRKIGNTANSYTCRARIGTTVSTAANHMGGAVAVVSGFPHVVTNTSVGLFNDSSSNVSLGSVGATGSSSTPVDISGNFSPSSPATISLSVHPTDATDSFSLLGVSIKVRP